MRSYRVVEQKYTSLQEEHQHLLRKNRESVNSTRENSSMDQLQELDVKYQKKIQLCRDQVVYICWLHRNCIIQLNRDCIL